MEVEWWEGRILIWLLVRKLVVPVCPGGVMFRRKSQDNQEATR